MSETDEVYRFQKHVYTKKFPASLRKCRCAVTGGSNYTCPYFQRMSLLPDTLTLRLSNPDMHAMMHAGIANWRFHLKSVAGKTSSASQRMRNQQFYVSGKRPMAPRPTGY